MSILYALPFLCDVTLYFAALGLVGLLGWTGERIIAVPPILFLGCALSGLLLDRGRWRFLGLIAAVPCLLLAQVWQERFFCIIPIVYLGLYIDGNRRLPDYWDASTRFRRSLAVAGAVSLFSVVVGASTWQRGLVYLCTYLALSVTLLRMLRHDEQVLRSRRFRILNLGGVALLCLAGYGLSLPAVGALLHRAWSLFAEYVLLNLLRVIGYILGWVLYFLSWILARIGAAPPEQAEMPYLDLRGAQAAPDLTGPEKALLSPVVQALILLSAVTAAAIGIFLLLRMLSRRLEREEETTATDTRERIDDEPGERRRRSRRGEPGEGVRRSYRRSLQWLRARGGRVEPAMDTRQLLEENAASFDRGAMETLREIYLPVRYGGRTPSGEDVRRAAEALEQLKRSGKREP